VSLIDVVITVKNGERYIGKAIESVISQTFNEWSLIIVNDCSTDNTAELLNQYADLDSRIKICHGNGLGIAAAANIGLGECSAPYVARFDADDICMPNRLSEQFSHLENSPNIVAVGSSVIQIDGDGRSLSKKMRPLLPSEIAFTLPYRNCLYHPTSLIRRSALNAINGYREKFKLAEDYDLWLRLSEIGELANIQEPLIYYRKHTMQVTDNSRAHLLTVYSVAAAIDYFLRKYLPDTYECFLDDESHDDLANKLRLLFLEQLTDPDAKALIRHAIRLLRFSKKLSKEDRENLFSVIKPRLTVLNRLKLYLYGICK